MRCTFLFLSCMREFISLYFAKLQFLISSPLLFSIFIFFGLCGNGELQGLTTRDAARIAAIEKSQADLKGEFSKVVASAQATSNAMEELKSMFQSFMGKSKDMEHQTSLFLNQAWRCRHHACHTSL